MFRFVLLFDLLKVMENHSQWKERQYKLNCITNLELAKASVFMKLQKLILSDILLEYNVVTALKTPQHFCALPEMTRSICPDNMFLLLSSLSFTNVLNLICSKKQQEFCSSC